jgi:hypothetical protein
MLVISALDSPQCSLVVVNTFLYDCNFRKYSSRRSVLRVNKLVERFYSRITLTADYTLEFRVEILYNVEVAQSGFSNTCHEVLVLGTMMLASPHNISSLPSLGS